MKCVLSALILTVGIAVAGLEPLGAQTVSGEPTHVKTVPGAVEPDSSYSHVKIVPGPADPDASDAHAKTLPGFSHKVPFETDPLNSDSSRPIRIVSSAEMTRHDRDLVADAESSIQERAGFENLEFDGEGWTYRQLVCPALPNHLFLRFSRSSGAGDMTMFSAAIPRNGDGRVHIIPIVRKGYSLFSPAPIAALTIAAFNRIRAEENNDAADWLGTGLCYAALAGANPQAEDSTSPESSDSPPMISASLIMTRNGGAIIRFVDVSDAAHPMEWNMVFDSKDKLVKATHSPAAKIGYRPRTVPVTALQDGKPIVEK